MKKRLTEFSQSTLSVLQEDEKKKYYVYCLVDPRDNKIFYVGKGTGNRVFTHEKYALGKINKEELFNKEELNNNDRKYLFSDEHLKVFTIKDIFKEGKEVKRFIINFGLTEKEAFTSEATLINFFKIVKSKALTNKISGYGNIGGTVEKLEEMFGFEPISKDDITADELILAVKIRNAFSLGKDETKDYQNKSDDENLKSRTLGRWNVAKKNLDKIKYVIGVHTGIENAVVSAYKIERYKEVSISNNKKGARKRYYFIPYNDSNRENTLKELGLEKKNIEDLTFGSGSAIAYINQK